MHIKKNHIFLATIKGLYDQNLQAEFHKMNINTLKSQCYNKYEKEWINEEIKGFVTCYDFWGLRGKVKVTNCDTF